MTRLPGGLTAEALAAAENEQDPESLAASVRLRQQFGPELAAAAVTQVVLRRRARTKFGGAADHLFFTRDGLEQASRPEVAAHHAARMAAAGVRRVVDLGCGIGTDALAFLRAGLEVVAVERDPAVARVAEANLSGVAGSPSATVVVGAAEDQLLEDLAPDVGIFCDPARRTLRGRSWRAEDLSPGWPFLRGLLERSATVGIKLGPGLPHALIPEGVEAEWLSAGRDLVECGLWRWPGATPGGRSALVLGGGRTPRRLLRTDAAAPRVAGPRRYVFEPLGAVIRAQAVATLAAELEADLLHPELIYLTADQVTATPFADAFAVRETFPYRQKLLRRWVADRGIGVLEIKTRGLQLDPARLRPTLNLRGSLSATVILTRTLDGPTVLVVDREESDVHRARSRAGP